MNKILQVEKLTKTVKGKNLVENIEFSVNAGEVFGFLGPNGSGKTTTIRMLVGLIKPTKGRVTIAGHDVFKEFKEAMKNVGCIVENPELYGYLTGWEVLKQYARMQGNISEDRLREIVEQVNLTERIHDRVKTYSLGMKQRLGIGQALIGRPKLLILDEPTNGLDPAGIKELREFVRFLVENEKMSVFISSHLLSEIQMMCDRVAIIDRGRMVTVSTVEDLLHHHSGDVVEWVAEPIEGAKEIISSSDGVSNLTIRDKSILCKVDQHLIPEIVQKLTSSGIAISKVAEKTITLEDLFMQLTTGSKSTSLHTSTSDLKEVH